MEARKKTGFGNAGGGGGGSGQKKTAAGAVLGTWKTKAQDGTGKMGMRRNTLSGVGEMMKPEIEEPPRAMIDPNLLVGPVYDDTNRRRSAIKGELTDITDRLSKALNEIDYMYDDAKPDSEHLVWDITKKVNELQGGEMKNQFCNFLDHYHVVNEDNKVKDEERENIFHTLADWFTMDHLDVDVKLSTDDSEQTEMKNNYTNTMATFEKLRKLQEEITKNGSQNKNTRILEEEKRRLEKTVMGQMQTTRNSISVQAAPIVSKKTDDAPWKHCASEIVGLLRNVRTEKADELDALSKSLKEMVENLEVQHQQIYGLQVELKEKKRLVSNFVEENNDLNTEVLTVRAKLSKYDKELTAAQKLLQKHFADELLRKEQDETVRPAPEPEILPKVTVSKMLKRLGVEDEEPKVKSMTSDPSLLRHQIRQQEDTISCMSEEISKLHGAIEELEEDLEETNKKIKDLEAQNTDLEDELEQKKQELEKSSKASHISEIKLEKNTENEETERLLKKLQTYKNMLADTEMKLSTAYKDIASLRRQNMSPDEPTSVVKEVKKIEKKVEKKIEKKEEPPKEAPKPKPKPKQKEMPPRKSTRRDTKGSVLPPIDQPKTEEIDTSTRENTLHAVGDIQGKLNVLIQDIMGYVNEVGRIVMGEDLNDMKSAPKVTMFEFGNKEAVANNKVAKDKANQKEHEKMKIRSTLMMNAQRAVALLREIYDIMSKEMNLQHDEYEVIYRAYKQHQTQARALKAGWANYYNNSEELGIGGMQLPGVMGMSRGGTDQYGGRGFNGNRQPLAEVSRNGGHWNSDSRHPKSAPSSSSLYSTTSSLKNGVTCVGMNHSNADLHESKSSSSLGALPFSDRMDVFFPEEHRQWNHRESILLNREEAKVTRATIPKKGNIKVTALQCEIDNPSLFNKKTEVEATKPRKHRPKPGKTGLINRKEILDQVIMGGKLIEAEEKVKEKEREVEDLSSYTVGDLASNILNFTDHGIGGGNFINLLGGGGPPPPATAPASMPQTQKQLSRSQRAPAENYMDKGEKAVTLPSISVGKSGFK